MKKLVTKDLVFLQKKLELLDTEECRADFEESQLNVFRQDIINTMGLLLKLELMKM